MRKVLLVSAGIAISILASAQQQTIHGVVRTGDDNEPAVGATVVVKGNTKIGVATDINGQFTLTVPVGTKSLIISYVGYISQEVEAKNKLSVSLQPAAKNIDETVVVAYGTTSRNAFTGSASKVSMESLSKKATPNLSSALEGEIPGVQVFTTSGQPGASATVQIRGIGSVNSDTSPLYVVDGIPYGSSLNGIDMSDIEAMTVLKDASATALYGSRAANGVVLITTRKGKSGKTVIEANGSIGLNMRLIPLYDVVSSPEAYVELAHQSLVNRYERFGLKESLAKSGSTLPTNTSAMLFSGESYSMPTRYNLWDLPSDQLIDLTTGKFNSDAHRRYNPESWEDAIFHTGKRYEGNIKISGGGDKTTFFTSLGYQKNVGYYIGSDFNRFSVRNNVSTQITNNLKAGLNLSYSYSEQNTPGQSNNANNGFSFVNGIPALFPVFEHDDNGNKTEDPKIPGGYSYDYGMAAGESSRPFSGGINPAGSLRLDQRETRDNNASVSANVEYRFLNDFKATLTYGRQYLHRERNTLTNPYYGDAAGVGRISSYGLDYTNQTFTQLISWEHRYGKHHVDAFVAHESSDEENRIKDINRKTLIQADNAALNNAINNDSSDGYNIGYAVESYFGQARYDWDNRYFVSASIRRDGSSRFASGNRWGTFGSIGGAWLISREKFLSSAKWIDNLKLKASYGVLGNQSLDLQYDTSTPDYYVYYDLYSVSVLDGNPSFSLYAKGNKGLTWEKSATINAGFESELFDRLSLDLEYFYKKTTQMLFRQHTAISLGYAFLPSNDGALSNQGIEFEIGYKALKGKNLSLTLRANGGLYTNKITSMPYEVASNGPKHYEVQGIFAYKKDHSVQDFYMPIYMGVNKENGLPLWKTYYTEDAQGNKTYITDYEKFISTEGNDPSQLHQDVTSDYNNATSEFVGKSAIPDLVGGFGFDLKVKGFTLSTSWSFGLGGYGYDDSYASLMNSGQNVGSNNFHKDIYRAWTPDNTDTDVPILGSGAAPLSQVTQTSSRFLTSRSYLNLSNVRLSYDIPQSLLGKIGVSHASVYVSGDNLLLLSARKGFVSMSSSTGQSSSYRYLPVSTITAGLSVRI